MVTPFPEDYPDEQDLERQFAKSVGPFVYVPLDLPQEEPPKVLLPPFIFTEEGV